jgi:hypothetical protein
MCEKFSKTHAKGQQTVIDEISNALHSFAPTTAFLLQSRHFKLVLSFRAFLFSLAWDNQSRVKMLKNTTRLGIQVSFECS